MLRGSRCGSASNRFAVRTGNLVCPHYIRFPIAIRIAIFDIKPDFSLEQKEKEKENDGKSGYACA